MIPSPKDLCLRLRVPRTKRLSASLRSRRRKTIRRKNIKTATSTGQRLSSTLIGSLTTPLAHK